MLVVDVLRECGLAISDWSGGDDAERMKRVLVCTHQCTQICWLCPARTSCRRLQWHQQQRRCPGDFNCEWDLFPADILVIERCAVSRLQVCMQLSPASRIGIETESAYNNKKDS